jgi:hypothetical protein
MKKAISYRLFGFGAVPRQLLPVLEQEGIIVIDEGMKGCLIAKHIDGPKKRYRKRSECFSACLALTKERIVCYTYWKRQINISTKDPKIAELYVDAPREQKLSISFESSIFREGWEGVMEFCFHTEKALLFRDALLSIGVQQGTALSGQSDVPQSLR